MPRSDAAGLFEILLDADADLPMDWLDDADSRGLIDRGVDHTGNGYCSVTVAGLAVIRSALSPDPFTVMPASDEEAARGSLGTVVLDAPPRLTLPDAARALVNATAPYIDDAAPGEKFNGLWCQRFDELCAARAQVEAALVVEGHTRWWCPKHRERTAAQIRGATYLDPALCMECGQHVKPLESSEANDAQ